MIKKIIAVFMLSVAVVSCKKETTVSDVKPANDSIAKNETQENQYKPIDTACSSENKTEDYITALQWYRTKINKEIAGNSLEQNNKVYEAYVKIRDKYTDCLNTSQTEVLDKYIDYHTGPETYNLPDHIKKMATELNKVGLEFREMGEGLTEIHSLPGYYESVFKNKVTPDYDAYILQKAKDNKENYAVNGGLLITWEELGDRLIAWENFINKYPKSPLIKATRNIYNDYLLDYLLGMDSDRIYDSEEGKIYDDKREAYNKLIKKYPNSTTAKKTKELIAAYDAHVPVDQIEDKINLRR
ncbi:Uncharacterised protein [Chryseobacterium nakagawai]|uniref:Uncharacterized protein n=1 Tax=Chryseobacterium nakagawai TaxID=1241982 RepID=A0AAD0YJC0_CHRNA|nr:hypothetical protein [Chryseobacterium nakagawai]AZA89544.1 hypothetical protein EG343_02320 [Chryseobacterium nakagawai]VEH20916.1 Uncharacterised protein [Chryseobacterium nakagawai]